MIDETSGIIGWPIGQQYRERAVRDEASTTTVETLVERNRERAKLDDAWIAELAQRANHWHDTALMLKRQRDTAEEERDGWKERAMKAEQQRQSLRDLLTIAEGQRDKAKADAEHWKGEWALAMGQLGGATAEVEALRKAVDAVRATRTEPQTRTGDNDDWVDGFQYGYAAALETVNDALDAALAVQPTKYKLPFIAHEKCYDFNSCARNQRCMYGKIGATGKWDNCFTPTSPALAVQPTTGDTNE